ncbi:PHP domain-containing protein [Zhaonella formicivorans]|uniref:PHP domain-containing protein n=1 Tax=Zhaonella formicivorans TaxID=2528593 RepID=UPI0010F244EC|nr:PHP domain-containing protein [Zhaonella formicivorans]
MNRWYQADLHIHTALSPCAGREMSPPAIVATAISAGLDLIAITDHNSLGNVLAVQQAAEGTGLAVLTGIEVQTIEEIHLLCLFPGYEEAVAVQKLVDATLPSCLNRPEYFGEQLLFDYKGNIIGTETKLLLNSCNLTINQLVRAVLQVKGIAIPAHIDRKAYSILEVLGFIPPGLFPAIEITPYSLQENRAQEFLSLGYPMIISSDAHSLTEIGLCKSRFYLAGPSLPALIEYLCQ